ncbi:uncharacterized protein [Physcomitrium patens]|uniref:Uncharacterized protein n=1 Tax=Physcomitrium patens TaxID=3218 RepID=A0A2K1JIE3_PHYPA|nr:uncharacterized protein LOC112291873 [Physcomitrium patens]PNR41323.1 hypothetical protein PHYPA_018726 [Physcomitrium patens]|eukprot:XP_024395577.1 uncharacterized protein LOC112291873 [Physcomitrella patens]
MDNNQESRRTDAEVSSCVFRSIEDVKSVPAFFSCTSGELLWGQVHTVIEGFTCTAPRPQELEYKVAARTGLWKVQAVFQDNYEGNPWHTGFVCHHVDANGPEILRLASEAGICNNGKFADLDIVFVNRYDWSGSHAPGCEIILEAITGEKVDLEEDFEDEKYFRSLVYDRFMLVDALGFPNLMQALKDGERLERRNYLMRRRVNLSNSSGGSSSSENDMSSVPNFEDFGTHLVVTDGEYDMGWMAFRNGELVGFVYDGAYSALEGDNLRLGDSLVRV